MSTRARAREARVAPRRRYHLHPPGLVYAFVTLLLGMGAVNSQNNLLFAAFGVSMAAVLVSGIVSGVMLLGLRVRREAVEPTRAGEPLSVRYEITNTGRFMPALGLRVEEASSRGATWAGRVTRPTAFVAHVAAGRTVHARASAWALSRGEVRFEAVRVVTRFPFGIIKKSVTFPQHSVGLVRPRRSPAPAVEASLAALQRTTGWAPVPAPGRDMELLGLREYRPGDSPRQIAWRASARTGSLVTREQMSTTPARWWIIVDLCGEDGALAPDEACERAIALAASLVERAAQRGVTAGLLVPAAALAVRPAPAAMGRGGSDHARRAAATHMVDELSRVDLARRRSAKRGAGAGAGMIPPDEPAIVVQAGSGESRLGGPRAQRVRAGPVEGAP